jgi:hypothetical protein
MLVKRGGKRRGFTESPLERAEDRASDDGQVQLHVLQPPWRVLTDSQAVQVNLPDTAADRRRLRQQMRALPPGRAVVLCCDALGSRRRSRRFLKDVGVQVLREYVAIPSLSSPTCYVEDTPQALRYFFSQVLALPKGGAVVSAGFGVAKSAARFIPSGWLSAVAPARIVVGQAATRYGDSFDASHVPTLLDVKGMQSLVLAFSKDPNAKLTVLLIPDGGSQPALAVKVPTTRAAEASIASERQALAELHSCLPAAVLGTIPALAQFPDMPARPALITTALPGIPMSIRYHTWRHLATPAAVRADFNAVERWLSRFQATTTGRPSPLDMDGGTVEALTRRFAHDPHLKEVLDRLDAIHRRLRTSNTPRTAVHGDFWFGNVLLVGDEVSGVVDWEAGNTCGEPVRDLVRFALTFALYLDRHSRPGRRVAGHRNLTAGAWGTGIAYAIDGQGWFPDLFRKSIQDGLARLGADPGCWRDAALAGIAEVAATADHLDFARLHWQLFGRLPAESAHVGAPVVNRRRGVATS